MNDPMHCLQQGFSFHDIGSCTPCAYALYLPHALFPSPYEHLTPKTIESCLSWQWQMNSMLLQRLTDWDYDSLYCVSVLSLYTHRRRELWKAVRETDMGRWIGLGFIVWQLLHTRQYEVSGTVNIGPLWTSEMWQIRTPVCLLPADFLCMSCVDPFPLPSPWPKRVANKAIACAPGQWSCVKYHCLKSSYLSFAALRMLFLTQRDSQQVY